MIKTVDGTNGTQTPSFTAPVMTDEHSRRQAIEAVREQYQNAMSGQALQNLGVSTDKDGNSHLFGLAIPNTLRPVVEVTYANLLPYIQRHGSEMVHKASSGAAARLPFFKGHSNKVGLIAENVFRWGLVAGKPIADVVHANRSHAKERKALFEEFAPVIDATGSNYQKNEVMRVAFDQLHHDMVTDMKMVAADIPTILPTALFALQDQANLKEKRKRTVQGQEELHKDIDRFVDAEMARHNQDVERTHRLNEAIQKKRDAFVKEWAEKGYQGPDGTINDPKKLREIFDEEFAPRIRRRRYQDSGTHGDGGAEEERLNKYESMMPWVIPVGTAVSQTIKATIEERADMRDDRMNAWKMIKHLKVELDEEFSAHTREYDHSFNTRSADEVYVNGIGVAQDKHLTLTDYIIEILQEHERDRAGIVTMAGDKPKELLGPAMVAKLRPTIDMVAEEIASGRLDAYALVTLVGEDKLIRHKANGARNFASTDDVQKSIDELLGVLSNREAVTADEFFANFADPVLIEKTLKENLTSMQGGERAFFAALFPDDILKQAGMGREEIIDVRKRSHEHMYEIIGATVVQMAHRDHEHLRHMGLSDDEIEHISELAEKVQDGDNRALQVAVDGRDKSVINAVRTVGLNEQVSHEGDGAEFWAKRVRESSKSAQEREEARRSEASEHDTELSRK